MNRVYEKNKQKYIEGYASRFNVRSKLLFEDNESFYEIIRPNSFDNVLKSKDIDCRCTYNHDWNTLLGRYVKQNGIIKCDTLKLWTDKLGLKFRVDVNETTLSNDIYQNILLKNLFENSFQFSVNKNDVKRYYEKNVLIKEISNISGLFDVSICVNGAYPETYLSIGNNESRNNNSINSNISYYRRKLELLKK